MRFIVISPRRVLPTPKEPTWYLVQDNWNDHGFRTQYAVHFSTADSTTLVGVVKILKKGQTNSDYLQVTEDFNSLDDNYVSVGQSLDYYERLAAMGIETRDMVLTALRDTVKIPESRPLFEQEYGWETSLFRDQDATAIDQFLRLAASLLSGDYTSLPSEELQFSFQLDGWTEAFNFDFRSVASTDPFDWDPPSRELPDRVIALIGRNGSGKSTVLARLARVAFGTARQRSRGAFAHLGSLTPIGIGFPRIIVVSYSAFDSFVLPGLPPQNGDAEDELEQIVDEREQIVKDARRGEGRFFFCGLRDVAGELESRIRKDTSLQGSADREEKTLLRPITDLAEEFGNTIEFITRTKQIDDLRRAFRTLATDSSLSFLAKNDFYRELTGQRAERLFMDWSTGQKIVVQIIASMVAHITPRSLVLLDEPEMHLHPPLLAALMHAVRSLLIKRKAFAIIATHSPVVLQETLARHIYIVRRDEAVTKISKPMIETFGENVGLLTNEVFGLTSQVTDFHNVLNRLIERHLSIEAIDELFEPYGLSFRARAYIMSQLPDKGESDVET